MKKKKLKKSFKRKCLFLVAFIAVVGLLFSSTLKVKAVPQTIVVEPGFNSLKEAVESAEPGAILKLKSGDYSGDEILINKAITIQGSGSTFSNAKNNTIIRSPIVINIEDGDNRNVVLNSFSTPPNEVTQDKIFINVKSKANLVMDDIAILYIHRAASVESINAVSLNFDENSSGSTLEMSRSNFMGTYDGIHVKSSNNTLHISNSNIEGRKALILENGSHNTVQIEDHSTLKGRSPYFLNNEVISIKKQSYLTMNIKDSEIIGKDAKDLETKKTATKIFALQDGEEKSDHVAIHIQGDSKITDENKVDDSTIFFFGNQASPSDENVVTIGKNVVIESISEAGEKGVVPIDRKYNTADDYAVVGIYDRGKNGTVKLYQKGAVIKELENTEIEGYNFKGWYRTPTFYEESIYTDASVLANMDLYPKYLKILTIKVGGKEGTPFKMEEGESIAQTKESASIIEALKALVKVGQEFKGYIVYGEESSKTYETLEQLQEVPFIEDSIIEAIHKVKVTINGVPFELESGDTLETLQEDTTYQEAKLQGRDKKDFSRFVTSSGETFLENQGITSSTTLTSKFYVYVTIQEKVYPIEENLALNSQEEIKAKLEALESETIEGKTFKQFEDENHQKVTKKQVVTKNMTISPTYTVQVSIKEKKYTIDEGQTLKDCSDLSDIKKELEDLKTSIPKGKNFDGYIVSIDKDETHVVLKTIDEVLEKVISFDTTIYARYNVIVTIQGKNGKEETFALETGDTLQNISQEDQERFENMKKDGTRTFSRFVYLKDGEYQTFTMDTEIHEAITLISKFFVTITIQDKKYSLEEDLTLEKLEEDGKNILNQLMGGDSEYPLEGKHFEKLVDEDGNTVHLTDTITKDKTIQAVYYYLLSVYKEHGNEESMVSIKLFENESLNTSTSETKQEDLKTVENALNSLKNSIEKLKKTFQGYIDITQKEETLSLEQIKAKVFNQDTIIDAKTSITVTIDQQEYTLEEGQTLRDLTGEGKEALEALKTKDNKHFTGFVAIKNGVRTVIDEDTPLFENTVIDASYDVQITIQDIHKNVLGKVELKDGETLRDLSENAVIKAIKNASKKTFSHFALEDGTPVEEATQKFDENTTITAIYTVKVTVQDKISGEQYFTIQEGSSLDTLKESQLATLKSIMENERFSRFVKGDETVLLTTIFDEDTTITTRYNVTITMQDNTGNSLGAVLVEEGFSLNDVQGNDQATLKSVVEKTEKRFTYFKDGDEKIQLDTVLREDKTVTAQYEIDITIDEELYTVSEGTTLKDLMDKGYKKPPKFVEFIEAESEDVIDEDTPLMKHTNVIAVHSIIVTIAGKEYTMKSGQTLLSIGNNIEEVLSDLKEVPQGKSSFSRFYYVKNGEKKTVDMTTKILDDIEVFPLYNVSVIVVHQSGDMKTELITIELEDGSTLKDCGDQVKVTLEEVLANFAKELTTEKETAEFFQFVLEDGTAVDQEKHVFDKETTIYATFKMKPVSSPSTNPSEETEKDKEQQENQNMQGGNTYPEKVPAPNTGIEENHSMATIVISIITVFILLITGCITYHKVVLRKN